METYLALRNHAGLRRVIWDRDKGVCRLCKLDCTALETLLGKLAADRRTRAECAALKSAAGVEPHRKTLWDADHAVPVSAGGGSCGLQNVQTLCVWCHRRKTAADRARDGRPPDELPPGAEAVSTHLPRLREMARVLDE